MKSWLVFIDTSIFISSNFNLKSKIFSSLRSLCISGHVAIIITDITIEEIKANLLKSVAEAIRISLRPNDQLGRYGGEEFVILLPDTDLATSEGIAKRIKDEVEKTEITAIRLEGLPSVTISIGVTEAKSDAFYEDIFKVADGALYKAKNSGRNCICYEK